MIDRNDLSRFGEWLTSQDYDSLKAVTDAAGAFQQHGIQWLRGERKPTHEQLEKLAQMFNTNTDYLYHLLGKIPPDIERSLRKATPDVFRAIRLYL